MESLANKYRPKTFDDVIGQRSIIKVLERQLELKEFKNCYMFCGPSGCGKTTLARIFANRINGGFGVPIEIDAASNNGVDNVKNIVADAQERSLDSTYKIYLIDECHSLTTQAWQAFLKCIEEPPAYTIFMFCTTDSQKVPGTIKNRCMLFNIQKISSEDIVGRLNYICNSEGFKNYEDVTDLISKSCHNQCRDAISLLDKVAGYNKEFDFDVALSLIGSVSYPVYFSLMNYLIDGDQKGIYTTISDIEMKGIDFKLFLDKFIEFCIDLYGMCIIKTVRTIPKKYMSDILNVTNISNAADYYNYVITKLIGLKNDIKNDGDIRSTVLVSLIQICRLL